MRSAAAPAMRRSAATVGYAAAAVISAPPAGEAGVTARGIGAAFAAVVVTSIGAGIDAALTTAGSISSSGPVVAFERPCGDTGAIESGAAAVVGVAVIECAALGVVPVVVIHGVMIVPIESPTIPAPAIAAVPADAKADAEREVRA